MKAERDAARAEADELRDAAAAKEMYKALHLDSLTSDQLRALVVDVAREAAEDHRTAAVPPEERPFEPFDEEKECTPCAA